MAILVEEALAVVAMVLWGLTTDALLGLNGEYDHEIATDEVPPAAAVAATTTMTPPPPPARRFRARRCNEEALEATFNGKGVASAKARRCATTKPAFTVRWKEEVYIVGTPRRHAVHNRGPGPCCLASYVRFVYGWFEVLCDFVVAIFEHVLDSRLPTQPAATVCRRLYLTEGDVHRQGTGGHPAGRNASSSRGKTSRSLASRMPDQEAKVRALTSARLEMEAVACQMREAMAAREAEVAWLRQELEDARGEAAEHCAALVSSSAEMHRVLEVLDELDKALDEACERTREVAERAKAADESKCAEMKQIIRDRVLVVEVLRGRNAELMVEVEKCVRGSNE